MKVFVFKPSNENKGKFDVSSLDDLPSAFQQFATDHEVGPYDYLECSGNTWTVIHGEGGLTLQEGRIRPTPGASSNTHRESSSRSRPVDRYKDAYVTAEAIDGIGSAIKVLGIVVGVIIVLVGMVLASQGGAFLFLASLVSGAVTAIPIYVLGILVSAQGQVLKATLDTAVNTSPFLDDGERALVMSLRQ
ncbi:hypothetical protein OAK76_02490 [Akkermansiaceae bacterium]|nr:hypothetical protein [Akkermansiaceae bacterium]